MYFKNFSRPTKNHLTTHSLGHTGSESYWNVKHTKTRILYWLRVLNLHQEDLGSNTKPRSMMSPAKYRWVFLYCLFFKELRVEYIRKQDSGSSPSVQNWPEPHSHRDPWLLMAFPNLRTSPRCNQKSPIWIGSQFWSCPRAVPRQSISTKPTFLENTCLPNRERVAPPQSH